MNYNSLRNAQTEGEVFSPKEIVVYILFARIMRGLGRNSKEVGDSVMFANFSSTRVSPSPISRICVKLRFSRDSSIGNFTTIVQIKLT